MCAPVNQSKIQQHILLEVAVQAELAFLTASSQEALLERVILNKVKEELCALFTQLMFALASNSPSCSPSNQHREVVTLC